MCATALLEMAPFAPMTIRSASCSAGHPQNPFEEEIKTDHILEFAPEHRLRWHHILKFLLESYSLFGSPSFDPFVDLESEIGRR